MNNKEQYYNWIKLGQTHSQTPEQRIEALANQLIESLYKPCEEDNIFIVDRKRLKAFGVDGTEPVNWGDLSATVEVKGDAFIVTIEEASPGDCPTLCDYIDKYLTAWGWDGVVVQTEW